MEKSDLTYEEYERLGNDLMDFYRVRGIEATEAVNLMVSTVIGLYKGNGHSFETFAKFWDGTKKSAKKFWKENDKTI